MTTLINIVFYLAFALYLAAGALVLWFLRRGASQTALNGVNATLLAAGLLLGSAFALRWAQWGAVPMTTLTDTVSLFVVFATLIVCGLMFVTRYRALLCFFAPAIALLAIINVSLSPWHLHTPPRDLQGLLLFSHVGLAFFAYALFFVASVASVAYVFQSIHLKQRRTTGLFQQLPSLEHLDRLLYRLISAGYPLFVITLMVGLFWAWAQRDLLGPQWWMAPKIVQSLLMAGFYAATFHTRRYGLLRGRKLAYFVIGGFMALLGVYLVSGLMELRTINFWESVS